MTAPTLDDFLLRLMPAPPQRVDPALLRARDSITDVIAALRAVGDSALEDVWLWQDHELDVRYGFYRQNEALDDARARIGNIIYDARLTDTPARPIVASATAARWDLHGLLASVPDEELDRVPGSEHWTVRQTLAHIVSGQRGYAWFTAWWLAQRDLPRDAFPERTPEDAEIGFPDEESEGTGTLADIQRRFDDILDLSAGVYGALGDEDLSGRARWSGMPVDVRFRLVRWASHIREHTIQVEKTLGFIGHPVTEVERLIRLIAAAYGRLEESLFMLPAEDERVAEALAVVESAAATAAASGRSVAGAAGV